MVRYNVEENITGEETLACSFPVRVNTESCAQFEKELFTKVQELKIPVIFDLEKVDYIASMFLGLCMRVAKEVGPQNFTIINTTPNVRKVFKISGFANHITIT